MPPEAVPCKGDRLSRVAEDSTSRETSDEDAALNELAMNTVDEAEPGEYGGASQTISAEDKTRAEVATDPEKKQETQPPPPRSEPERRTRSPPEEETPGGHAESTRPRPKASSTTGAGDAEEGDGEAPTRANPTAKAPPGTRHERATDEDDSNDGNNTPPISQAEPG